MTERYTESTIDNWESYIVDNETGKKYGSAKDIAYWMNELNDENEQLKQEIKDLQVKFRKFNNHMIGDVE